MGNAPFSLGAAATVDDKIVGMLYLVTAFAFLVIGGIEALIMRLQLAGSDLQLLHPEAYNQLVTMHGISMTFWYTSVFGGGLALYSGNTRVGGLGISGDTACADHEIAKRVRHAAGLDPAKGQLADDIMYSKVDGASVFTHPLCPNTWRNGQKIGDEPVSAGY